MLHVHSDWMSFVEAVSGIETDSIFDPQRFELTDEALACRRAVRADVAVWVAERLIHGDAHHFPPEFDGVREPHEFAFEDILDGYRFLKAWGHLDESRVDPRELRLRRRIVR